MKITKAKIGKLRPCKDRFDNYLKFYGDKSFTKRQFMGLKNISHEDKMWVAFRLMSKEQPMKAVAAIARSVLHLYEAQHSNDLRPRQAIEAAEQGRMTPEIRNAAYYAADAAADAAPAAAYAAYAAADAAANAADAAAYAAHYAARAAAYAARAAHAAADAGNREKARRAKQKEIRTIILTCWKDGEVK